MQLLHFNNFTDYSLLDTGNGKRLERWGEYILIRPDPQIIWSPSLSEHDWQQAAAEYVSQGEHGHWVHNKPVPDFWDIKFHDITLLAKLTPFKHTGIFAEQAAHWEWLEAHLKDSPPLRILNLFAYTGGATMWLTKRGHTVTHVDASRPSIAWAKKNQAANNFTPDSIRWILDDAATFVARELKRGQQYDGIIMDPPAFGHTPDGKSWKFNRDLPGLLANCSALLSPTARFLIINGYATNSSSLALEHILKRALPERGAIDFGELCLKQDSTGELISTGIFTRWSN
jgi:23S rRNA (cytosine1962-C5)-methyltransferase